MQHDRSNYKLHAFVIMPDHLHLRLTPGNSTMEQSMQLIKGGFSRHYHQAGGLQDAGQTGYADHRCRDLDDFLQHKRYLQQNPVKAGLCATAEDYLSSSASRVLSEKSSLNG